MVDAGLTSAMNGLILNRFSVYNIMTKLINKRFYKTREEAQQKCDVFFAVGRITDEQYTELCALIESVYAE